MYGHKNKKLLHLLIASNNLGKILEITGLLENLPVEIITPAQLDLKIEVNETGNSYAENAAIKALAYAHPSNLLTLADDTGLEVNALGGLPGINSARLSRKQNATDKDRRELLLKLLEDKPKPWHASFHCAVILATPMNDIYSGEGACQGEIILEERGEFGFGYDPIFLVHELGKTMAELPLEDKNLISHRAKAVEVIKPYLLNFAEEFIRA